MVSERRTCFLGIAAIGALAVALVACSGGSDSTAEAPTATADPALAGFVVKLTRVNCGWGCGWFYDVTIHGDGSVEYEGSGELDVVGPATATIPQEQVRLLSDRFDEIGFADLEDIRCTASDVPYSNLTLIREPGINRTIEFCNLRCDPVLEDPANTLDEVLFDTCVFHSEPALQDLAELIDEITDSQRWTGEL